MRAYKEAWNTLKICLLLVCTGVPTEFRTIPLRNGSQEYNKECMREFRNFLFKIYFHYNCSKCNIQQTSQYHNTWKKEKETLNHIISTQKYNLEHLCTAKRLQALLNFMPANKSQTVFFGVSTNMLYRLEKSLPLAIEYKMAFNIRMFFEVVCIFVLLEWIKYKSHLKPENIPPSKRKFRFFSIFDSVE